MKKILFLALDSPWPAHGGSTLRSLGLLQELGKRFSVELIVLNQHALTDDQISELKKYAQTIEQVHLKDISQLDKALAVLSSLINQIPYHSAVIEQSFREHPELRKKILQFSGPVFTSIGHWGCLVRNQHARNWVLNQCDADVEFWRVYANQTTNFFMQLSAMITYQFSKKMFPGIYANVGRVISVCDEDKKLTLSLTPSARVEVIENGVDCEYYYPEHAERDGPPRLLFTGTSVARNVLALRRFAVNIFPLILQKIPDVELMVAGRFSKDAQAGFKSFANIKFSGPVPDIRPYFNQSDVFIAPFNETHGSKLKIAEAMSMAMPIVSTVQGIRGFSLVDRESVYIAHDDAEFAFHVIELLENKPVRIALGLSAREKAENTLNWSILGVRLEKIITDIQKDIS